MKQCTRCLMHSDMPNITFDKKGLCSYCQLHDSMEKQYPTGKEGRDILESLVEKVKDEGKNKPYDCIVGVSGGCDSSFMLYRLKMMELNPLAVNFNNGWATDISISNMNKMCDQLDVDLYTYNMDEEEFNDISRSFLQASVPDADVPSDIAIAALYYKMLQKYDLDYYFCGHSFRTEGTVPLGWTYMDGKYIESVHKQFGKLPMKTFLNLDIDFWLKNIHRTRIRPLYYLSYNKEDVKTFLSDSFGWQWYGGHHHEHKYTKFVKTYLLPKKFGIDKRYVEFSALIRSGNITKEQALKRISTPEEVDPGFVSYVKNRLNLSDSEFDKIMALPIKSYKDYETYKEYFIKNRDMFKDMLDKGYIPRTFFEKYCS